MDTIDRILELMEINNVTAAQLTREAGITNGLITQWKQRKQNPSYGYVVKIASYFNVSVDYLLGNETKKEPAPEDELYEYSVAVNRNGKRAVYKFSKESLDMLEMFIEKFKETEGPDF